MPLLVHIINIIDQPSSLVEVIVTVIQWKHYFFLRGWEMLFLSSPEILKIGRLVLRKGIQIQEGVIDSVDVELSLHLEVLLFYPRG